AIPILSLIRFKSKVELAKMNRVWLFAALVGCTFACMPMKPNGGGIPVACGIISECEGACLTKCMNHGAAQNPPMKCVTTTSRNMLAVMCPQGGHIAMVGPNSLLAQLAETLKCDTATKTWIATKNGQSAPLSTFEGFLGSPIQVSCQVL
ncbi:hypothetical protein PMAYCL1PPCAC_21226, partial [Pristionchus mayeri]